MFIDGHEVDAADTAEQAREMLEGRYEYEGHAADLEEARHRLRQVHERLDARYPRAVRDPHLSSVLACLGDALGAGPEASAPDMAKAAETDIFRQQLSPVLWIVVEASLNTVLEVTTPAGRVLSRVLVSRTVLRDALDTAYLLTVKAEGDAEERRLRGPDERRRTEGKLEKREAVEWLIVNGPASRQRAVHMVRELSEGALGGPFTSGMTYDGTHWVVPDITGQPAQQA